MQIVHSALHTLTFKKYISLKRKYSIQFLLLCTPIQNVFFISFSTHYTADIFVDSIVKYIYMTHELQLYAFIYLIVSSILFHTICCFNKKKSQQQQQNEID